jgi:Asp/Glu/hydantoin racemase
MKTPTKQKSVVDGGGGVASPGPKVFHKRFELLVVFCGPTREDVVGAPDVGILPCAVPGDGEMTRIGQHVTEGKILELIQAQTFDGVLIDSIFDTGVELSREAFDCGPVVGTFLPAVAQAALVGGRFGLVVVCSLEGGEQAAPHLLRDLAVKHGVADRMQFVQCVAQSAVPRGEEHAVAELCAGLGRRHDVQSVVVWGAPVPGANAWLRSRGDPLVLIDATLAGLNAVEGMMRQNLRPSRKLFPKSGSLKKLF